MRNLSKISEPEILKINKENWQESFRNDPSPTNRTRYRCHAIKTALKEETGFKCVYCESKIGHNTPGDVEHKIPSSKVPDLHYTWENLTIACTECNRRKNNYYQVGTEFLDPYSDDVESLVEHLGPLVLWATNNTRAEITIKTLELNDYTRTELIMRKIEIINDFKNLIERYQCPSDPNLKELLLKQIQDKISKNSEYSGMLKTMFEKRIS